MGLKKGINFLGVFSIASGAMISSGIFILPGMAFAKAGPAIFISYLIAGILGLLGIFSVIELTTAMPKAGGDYYFINKTFGPLFGTISGTLSWTALSLKSAFAIFGISEIIFLYLGISPLISGGVLCLFFILLNIKGAKEAVVFQIVLVLGLLALMTVYLAFGFREIRPDHFRPLLGSGFNGVLRTSSFVFISFGGLVNIANIAEEVKKPKRNIPLGIIISTIVVTLFYTLITFVITGTLPAEDFMASLTPVADSARITMGLPGYIIIITASMLAFFTTANGGLMSASRYPLALSRDKLFPKPLQRINKRFQTPALAIIITGGLIYASLLLPLEILVKVASTVILTSYVLTNIAVIILRESRIINYKPSFKAPLYPWLQIISIAVFTFFIIDLGLEAIEISLGLLFFSFLLFMIYGRKAKGQEFALLHLMKRITDKRLTENLLEDELLEILVNRDDIEQDHFDRLIRNAVFVEMEEAGNFEDAAALAAETLAPLTGTDEDTLQRKFIERQEQINTAVSPFLGIPHIILDGEDKVVAAIVRCRKGIRFSEKEDSVKAAIFLGATQDQRILHLRTIAAIASLVNSDGFQKKWLEAANEVELKSLMVLSSRKRYH